MNRRAWWVTVHEVSKSQTWLSDWACVCVYIKTVGLLLNSGHTAVRTLVSSWPPLSGSPHSQFTPASQSWWNHAHPCLTFFKSGKNWRWVLFWLLTPNVHSLLRVSLHAEEGAVKHSYERGQWWKVGEFLSFYAKYSESERREWKNWLKGQIQKTKIMASGPITSWQIDGETMETVRDFIFLGSKKSLQIVTVAVKLRCLFFGRKVMTNLDNVLKSRDITLPTKVHLVKAMVFPVVMYGCESWSIKKAEHQRIDAFELWCWRRLLRVPWTTRRSNQSILKEISPEYSLEGLMWKLKIQHFGHLMRRTNPLGKTLMLGKTEGRRRRGQQRMRWLNGITDSMDMNMSKLR